MEMVHCSEEEEEDAFFKCWARNNDNKNNNNWIELYFLERIFWIELTLVVQILELFR